VESNTEDPHSDVSFHARIEFDFSGAFLCPNRVSSVVDRCRHVLPARKTKQEL
jgi:hypothetical protein